MAKKKRETDGSLEDLVNELIADVGDDRHRLSNFIDDLLAKYPEEPAGIAEYIAKLMDASTRQLQVKAGVVKALVKQLSERGEADDVSDIQDEIGLPFKDEEEKDEDGAN